MLEPNSTLVSHLAPKNFLSFGTENPGIDLRALNVFIGPNGCGKSNLVEAINFIRSAPRELRDVTRKGGGVNEWIWKGRPEAPASVEWTVKYPQELIPVRHTLSFESQSQAFRLHDERIEESARRPSSKKSDVYLYYRYQRGNPIVNTVKDKQRKLAFDTIEPDRSILAQRRDPETYPVLSWLAQTYDKIRIYREWAFGRNAVFREPQQADMRNDTLEEDFSNLGLILSRLRGRSSKAKNDILAALRDLYEGFDDFNIVTEGGTVQVFFHETGFTIPATRLSDGTLRYLCLLAILCDPDPPPLICIEEPELGLHPDILPKVADLLRSASERTQLMVTTHSDILVDALSDTPECVVACDKLEGQTIMKRMNAEELEPWLEKYRLGELWVRGGIGGTRW